MASTAAHTQLCDCAGLDLFLELRQRDLPGNSGVTSVPMVVGTFGWGTSRRRRADDKACGGGHLGLAATRQRRRLRLRWRYTSGRTALCLSSCAVLGLFYFDFVIIIVARLW